MRIALYVHCYFPEHFFGTEAYTRQLARELAALGHEPAVVTATFAGEPEQAELIERYEFDGIPVLRIDKNRVPHADLAETYDQPSMAKVHGDLLDELAPDLIHVCHLMNHTAALLEVASARAVPTFATFTDFFGFCFNNKLEAADGGICAGPDASRANCVECLMKATPANGRIAEFIRHPWVRPIVARAVAAKPSLAGRDAQAIAQLTSRPDRLARSYRTYRAAIAPSRFLQDAYKANGFDGGLKLSRFGIEIDRSPKPPRPDARIRLGYIGQLAPHKGIHLLLDALRNVAAEGLSLEIWGNERQDPAYSADLRARAEGLDVTFRGTFPVAEIAGVLRDIDMIVIPSTWTENSPLILLQALATHTPVLVSDVPGLVEFVQEGIDGLSFARGDTGSLAGALKRLAEAPDTVGRMSAATAYERTPRDMAQDVLDMYRSHGVRVS